MSIKQLATNTNQGAIAVKNKSTGNIQNTVKYKKPFLKYASQNKWLYFLVMPGILYLLIFNYIPMFGIVIAFKDFNFVKGIWGSSWIGFDNFERLFRSKDFYIVLKNSILLSFYRLIWGFPFPILVALLLNEIKNMTFKKVTQTVMYLPHFISWVVVSGMIINFLAPSGAINYIVQMLGGKSVSFLQKPEYFRSIVVAAGIWKEVGWGTIVYLAAMAGIDQEMYEAAYIDGANRIQRILYITLPSILPTIFVLLILNMGNVLRNGFEQIFLLYNPMVYSVADVFETYTYRIGLQSGRYSYSAAVGIFQSVVGLILITVTNKIAKRMGQSTLY